MKTGMKLLITVVVVVAIVYLIFVGAMTAFGPRM